MICTIFNIFTKVYETKDNQILNAHCQFKSKSTLIFKSSVHLVTEKLNFFKVHSKSKLFCLKIKKKNENENEHEHENENVVKM